MGQEMVRLLVALMAGEHPGDVVLPTSLVLRAST
jgi:DNA-binding LacI/PurR family transcriptional regulator